MHISMGPILTHEDDAVYDFAKLKKILFIEYPHNLPGISADKNSSLIGAIFFALAQHQIQFTLEYEAADELTKLIGTDPAMTDDFVKRLILLGGYGCMAADAALIFRLLGYNEELRGIGFQFNLVDLITKKVVWMCTVIDEADAEQDMNKLYWDRIYTAIQQLPVSRLDDSSISSPVGALN